MTTHIHPAAWRGARGPGYALACLSLALLPGPARAQSVACSSLPNPVYVQAGDTQEPLLKDLGKRLRDLPETDSNQLTLIYVPTGSCTNVAAMYAGAPITVNPRYIPSSAQDPAWTPASASPTCTIEAGGRAIDLGNSAVLIDQCTTAAPPPGLETFQGGNQPYLFVVPRGSSQIAITAEEAYFVFGFGQTGGVEPWTDENLLFIRTTTKSTLLAMAANIRVPAPRWKGVRKDQSSEVVNLVASSGVPERTIGILGGEIYDQNRTTLKALAFRAYRQRKAYFADSTASSFDKKPMRDGHYTVWSPTLWLARTATLETNPRVKLLLDLILGKDVPGLSFRGLEVVIAKGLVPQCAMKVSRTAEGGDLSIYQDPAPCGCYFESRTGGASTGCVACTDDGPCGAGTCRFGYCEAR